MLDSKKFVETPFLPQREIDTVIISGLYKRFAENLKALGIKSIFTHPINELQIGENTHADMQALHVGMNKIIILKNNIHLKNQLSKLGFEVTETINTVKPIYPQNILLNCFLLDNKIFGKISYIDKIIKEQFKDCTFVDLKQGYAKCSTAIVSDNAIITSDENIYKIAVKNNIDVLKIRTGYIHIENFDYGFIGGTCGKISKDILAFCGDIKKHPDYKNIHSFCKNYNVDLISLSNDYLTDLGGILPICYKKNS